MVLLTSSSISVLFSFGIIFVFTFLLFLSGYILQQQTVRSLQAALHPPPLPTPTLPVYFQDVQDRAENSSGRTDTVDAAPVIEKEFGTPPGSRGHASFEQSLLEMQPTQEDEKPRIEDEETPLQLNLAYVQALTSAEQICSALLFFQSIAEYGSSVAGKMIVYPEAWERETASDAISSALALMRIAGEKHKIAFSPLRTGDDTDEQILERELIKSLSEYKFAYDRVLYLRSPGLVLNVRELDTAVQASATGTILSGWEPQPPQASFLPSALLITPNSETLPLLPPDDLVIEAATSHDRHHEDEMEIEALATRAGYIHFDNAELEHRRSEKELYGGVFNRYERGRLKVCSGISFQEKVDLRKRGR